MDTPSKTQYRALAETCKIAADLFQHLAKQQEQVEEILIGVKAVVDVTREHNGKYVEAKRRILRDLKKLKNLKEDAEDSELFKSPTYEALRGVAAEFLEHRNRFYVLAQTSGS